MKRRFEKIAVKGIHQLVYQIQDQRDDGDDEQIHEKLYFVIYDVHEPKRS